MILRTIYVFEFDICITILLLAIDPLCNVFIPKEYELCYKAINFVIEVIFPENAIYVDTHNNKVNIYVQLRTTKRCELLHVRYGLN